MNTQLGCKWAGLILRLLSLIRMINSVLGVEAYRHTTSLIISSNSIVVITMFSTKGIKATLPLLFMAIMMMMMMTV
jgi:hypothetical protein